VLLVAGRAVFLGGAHTANGTFRMINRLPPLPNVPLALSHSRHRLDSRRRQARCE
jgi:hypothetical protein